VLKVSDFTAPGGIPGVPYGFVALDRQFGPLEDQNPTLVEAQFLAARPAVGALTWSALLEKKRVVILAEAGSGKSEELQAKAAELRAEGKFAFYARLQDIGHEGFPAALSAAEQRAFEAWKASDQPAWVFADSVDEAKLDNISLDTALRRLANGVDAAADRAHIYLSSRYTDWEYRRDLARFSSFLPLPDATPVASVEPPEVTLGRILGSEQRAAKPEVKIERPSVVLMAPLDSGRIRLFAAAKGVQQLDAFVAAIEVGNLLSMAARPVDLIWLVDYWQREQRFGRLAEMLDASLRERLKETNPLYARQDPISNAVATAALERIGAAFDFGRTDRLSVPDSALRLPLESEPFGLDAVLPDWSSEHRQRLLSRPVFDPETFGCARLHNDNQGVVRSYLNARWLHARRQAGCPYKTIASLLFADTYGLKVVRPSMSQTVAWLAIWDEDVARVVLDRDPMLLLSWGDPASLSPQIRSQVVQRVAERMVAEGDRFHRLDVETVKRLASPDTIPVIRTLWQQHKHHPEVSRLLLLMIELGRLASCVDIAEEAAFTSFEDRYTAIYAGRALLATADKELRSRYAERIKRNFSQLTGQAVWDALEEFVPASISAAELLQMLRAMTAKQRDANYGLQTHGPRLVANLTRKEDVEELLTGILPMMGKGNPGHEETDDEKALEPAVSAAAERLLAMSGPGEAPEIAIDAAIRLGSDRLYRTSGKNADLQKALHASAERRRLAFWCAARLLCDNPLFPVGPITSVSHLDILGWPPGLKEEDLRWLLADIADRADDDDKKLATNATLTLWREHGEQHDVLKRINAAAHPFQSIRDQIAAWLAPPRPNPEMERLTREHEKLRQQHQEERAKRDNSWMDFVNRMKADPRQLDAIPPPEGDQIDGRLWDLWQLFNRAESENGRYAIDDTSTVEPLFGPELTSAMVRAFNRFWRQWRPVLESERAANKRNVINLVDCMGIAGVSFDAKEGPGWVEKLTVEEALRAAQYGSLELNGFPPWFEGLAARWPREALAVMLGELRAQLDAGQEFALPGMLQDLIHGAASLTVLVAPHLQAELEARPLVPAKVLSQALDVLARALAAGADLPSFANFALVRFAAAEDEEQQALYLGAAFGADSTAAIEALGMKLAALPRAKQTQLAKRVLPRIFGNHAFGRRGGEVPDVPFAVLEDLVVMAFRTIRPDEDNEHTPGEPYSPDDRDSAEASRSSAFNQLANTPGPAAFAALRRLEAMADFPVPKSNLARLIEIRAQQDSERAPWAPDEPYEFEKTFDVAPTTPADLQEIALGRLADIQHALHHSDFSQGLTVKALPDETEVQKWLANELQHRQGRAFTVDREPHVVDEKKPDIRLRATASAASLPVEVKVVDKMSLSELKDALLVQLAGRYLRAEDAKHGVLLLVHQDARPTGWHGPGGEVLSFQEVVSHLAAIADTEAAKAQDSPQAKIAVIDVSSLAPRRRRRSSGAR
jgi:hypothetical protein